MSRRKIAIALAALLGVAALALVAAALFLYFSPQDYRLIHALKRAARIEVSYWEEKWEIHSIDDPNEVAEIVSTATTTLGRRPPKYYEDWRPRDVPGQARMLDADGGECAAIVWGDYQKREWSYAVRALGSDFRGFGTSPGNALANFLRERRTYLGLAATEHEPESVDFEFLAQGNPTALIGLRRGLTLRDTPRAVLTTRAGRIDGRLDTTTEGFVYFVAAGVAREDIDAVQLTLDGKTTTLPVPRPRYEKPPPFAEGR